MGIFCKDISIDWGCVGKEERNREKEGGRVGQPSEGKLGK